MSTPLTDKDKDSLLSVMAATHDIQRWTLQLMEKGRLSQDRRKDMIHQAKAIAERMERMGK